jgi:quercetin dioxygenase-like cupin family protein
MQSVLTTPPMTPAEGGVGIEHFFGGGAYVKLVNIPAGMLVMQHTHPHDHLSFLVSGKVLLEVEGESQVVEGFKVLTIKAGKPHSVTAITPTVWACIWGTDDTDPDTVDDTILKG